MTSTSAASLTDDLRQLLRPDQLLTERADLLVYECDAYLVEKRCPDAVVFPETAEEVADVVRLCNQHDVPIVPRGAGTSLSGGTLAIGGGVMIVFSRMRSIDEVNIRDRYAVVQPGVVNIWLSKALAGTGFHYAPDPSSQGACTIGGNVAANAGGPHTLKYGVTTNHVLGIEVVTPDGQIVQFGGPAEDTPGPDLVGAIVGSEGTLGIVTKIWVRLTRNPESCRTMLAIFDALDDATTTVSQIIGAGIIPAALEMMDQAIITAVEKAFGFGFPLDAEAVLIIEIDGLDAALDVQRDRIMALCNACGAREIRMADSEEERLQLWKSRKQAFGALGRLTTSFFTQDGMVPRTKLPQLFRRIVEIGKKYDVRIVNVFHAGDGNVHPIFLYDERDFEQVDRVHKASAEIMQECIEFGGSVTGEHGIGVEKIPFMSKMFSEDDLDVMHRMRHAFNPENRLCPNKKLPTGGGRAVVQKTSSLLESNLVPKLAICLLGQRLGVRGELRITIKTLPITSEIAPQNAGALAEVVREAAGNDQAVYTLGGRTALDFGLVPTAAGIGLSTISLNQIVDYDPRDLTITTEAGVTMAQLAETLAAEGQELPIDVPNAAEATLGGMMATNWSGLRRYGRGTLRDYLIGIAAVDGRGVAFQSGGRVMKNVAGYDFAKLLTGSLGTLAVVTRLSLKVRPRAELSAVMVCSLRDWEQTDLILTALNQSVAVPTAIELLAGSANLPLSPCRERIVEGGEASSPSPNPTGGNGSRATLVVSIEGNAAEVATTREMLIAEWNDHGADSVDVLPDDAGRRLCQKLVEFPHSGLGDQDNYSPLVVKIAVRPSCVIALCRAVLEIDPAASVVAHAGNGIVLTRFTTITAADVSSTIVGKLRPAALAGGGDLVVLRSEFDRLTPQVIWGGRSASYEWLKKVKQQFDPNGILNRGRLFVD